METVGQDIKYACRMLARSPGFAAVVVLILAVGIGANTAVFSVVNAVILRPLPYPNARRLMALCERPQTEPTRTLHGRFLLWREQNQVFEQMGAYGYNRPYIKGIDRARYIPGIAVSPNVLPLLGVPPLLGRGFLPTEDQPGKERVIILSHSFWRDDFGGAPNVIGKTMTLDGQSHTIVGVMPACRASDVHVSRILKEGQTRSSTGRGWQRLHGGLVIAQTGLSLILLIGAALLVRTWIALQRVDLGFRPENMLSAEIMLPAATDKDPQRCRAFFDPLLERIRALPGVQSAGYIDLFVLGVAVGLAGAYALTRLLSSLLYGVPPTDLPTFLGVSLVLVAIALLASYLPARRAARIDPMEALRYE
jgi:hypothetical protein